MTGPGKQKILVAPLDWGLGHATRCIPVIRKLQLRGFDVTLAASGRPLALLKQEFPDVRCIDFPGFSPDYPASGSMALRMLGLVPSFIRKTLAEHRKLNQWIDELGIDIVISDNRYGLWSRKVRSVLIIHQIRILSGKSLRFLEPLLYAVNRLLISRFDECWIPDFEGVENLSGKLSHAVKLPANSFFIGPLSRFSANGLYPAVEKKGILVLLSGPEPQRSILEKKILEQLGNLSYSVTVICGRTDSVFRDETTGSFRILSHALSNEIGEYLRKSELVICRPGYSTIMDLAVTGGKALFIPTPGQTEQEYLAVLLKNEETAWFTTQSSLNLSADIPVALAMKGFKPLNEGGLLSNRISTLTKK